ncbi:MAG TPA: hypothetical protein VLK65_06645 [Vicinamibacteria bacterium]|nr:hypothetical protein [Vicinamibacteria bacterium]
MLQPLEVRVEVLLGSRPLSCGSSGDTGDLFDESERESESGARSGNLMALRFDPATREIGGEPFIVQNDVETASANGYISYAVSDAGTFVYSAEGGEWIAYESDESGRWEVYAIRTDETREFRSRSAVGKIRPGRQTETRSSSSIRTAGTRSTCPRVSPPPSVSPAPCSQSTRTAAASSTDGLTT